jgi:hypothetical protein
VKPLAHRAHDYRFLIQRWRSVARRAGVPLQRLTAAGGEDGVFFLKSPALKDTGGIYISAGIHGDEPAGVEALVAWAETNVRRLARLPLLLFPCLNPWGLVHNRRTDAADLDLNRLFHRDDQPLIQAVKRVVAPCFFEVALMLHEDYDGQGFYLYEIKRALPFWGEELLAVAGQEIAIDPRVKIEGRRSQAGLIRRRIERRWLERVGYPEAIWLHKFHARRALTIETPSEFALEQRVRAQVAVLDESVRRVVG